MDIEKRKKCDSNAVKVCVAIFILYFISQFKVSPISKLISTIIPDIDARDLQVHSNPSSAGPILCNRTHFLYDICTINNSTVLDPKLSTLYVVGTTNSQSQVEKIKPYPRKWDIYKMALMKEFTLTSSPTTPHCTFRHNASALVFNVGGYTGNFHNDFSEELIPLFITLNSISSMKGNNILVISNARDWWLYKYTEILQHFTEHRIINLDIETDTHCFPSATIGLMSIDPKEIPNSKTILNFHGLLKNIYGNDDLPKITLPMSKPRLLLAGRGNFLGRVILNRAEAKEVAEEEGFHVIDFEPVYALTMRDGYNLVSSSHLMVGVYGAALTHLLSLRPGSIFMQIIPIGADWLADMHFGTWARDLGLDYMEYKILVGESSLVEKYSRDDEMLKNPKGLKGKWGGWTSVSVETYLMEQNVKLDLVRFRRYLKKAYVKAKAFM